MKWQLIFLEDDVKHFVSLTLARSHCTCCFLAKSTLWFYEYLWIDPVIAKTERNRVGSWCYVFCKSFVSSCLWRFHRFRGVFCLEYFGFVEFKVMCICYGDESYQRGDRCKQRVKRNGQVTRPGIDRWRVKWCELVFASPEYFLLVENIVFYM